MLRQKVPGSFVCLRCRLQLGTAVPRRRFSAVAPAQREQPAFSRQSVIDAIAGLNHKPQAPGAPEPNASESKPHSDAPRVSQNQQSVTNAVAKLHDAGSGGQESEAASRDGDAAPSTQKLYKIVSSKKGLGRVNEEKVYATVGLPPLLQQSEEAGRFFRKARPQEDVGRPLYTTPVYKSRGKHLSVENEHLPVDVLGSPSTAIVLRSRRKGSAKKSKPEAGKLEEAAAEDTNKSNTRLDDALESDHSYPSLSESIRNIDELRPRGSHPLLANIFADLKKKLVTGFTNSQLQQYIHKFRSLPQSHKVQEHLPEDHLPEEYQQEEQHAFKPINPPWIVKKHPWIPLVSQGANSTGDVAQWYMGKSMSPKDKLAVRVMLECWNLTSHSALETRGRLDVRLADTEFGLLLVGTRKWLRDIARNSLGAGNQIEALRPSSTISILAQQPAAESILMEINNILSHAKTTSINVDLVSPEPLDPELLEDVGRLTNTLVRLDTSGKQILVSWINLPEPPEGAGNLGDVVLRLLLEAFHPATRTSSAVTMLPALRPKNRSGGFVVAHDCEPKLPWHERRTEWARWASPIIAKGKKPAQTIPPNLLPHPIEVTQWDATLARKKGDPFAQRHLATPQGEWSAHTTTTAVFGHVLHAQREKQPPPNVCFDIKTAFKACPRTFIPVLPPFTALKFPTNLIEEGLWHSTILLHFLPDPHHSLAPGTPPPPPLELRIEADHKEVKRIVSLRAISSSFAHDVLLPMSPVDIRFLQERYFELPGAALSKHVPGVISFVEQSDLCPWDDKLTTPPTLPGVRLPLRLLLNDVPSKEPKEVISEVLATTSTSAGQTEATGKAPETSASFEVQTDTAGDFIDANYRFAGAEIQRIVSAEYEGFKITYRSTEAGKHASKTAQVSLEAVEVRKKVADVPFADANAAQADEAVVGEQLDGAEFMRVVSRMANKAVNRQSTFGWEIQQ